MVDGFVVGVGKGSPASVDLRSMMPSFDVHGLANEFALSELAFRHQLSSAIVMSPRSSLTATLPATVDANNIRAIQDPVTNTTTFSIISGTPQDRQSHIPLDAHNVGSLMTLLAFTAFYRGLAACVYEFSRAIGSEVFEKTVIEIASEFNRSPRVDCVGSDHGFNGTTFSLFSGSIDGTHCIGDIYSEPPNSSGSRGFNPGTWGWGAGMASLGGIKLNQGNILSSLAALFGVASPAPNSLALLELAKTGPNRGKIIPQLGRGKNVSEEG
jgi:hypothetical protein